MTTVNYLRVVGCEHATANCNESYRKDHQNGMKFMKVYLYSATNQSIEIRIQR